MLALNKMLVLNFT